jgi:hypothetical protein
MQAKDLIRTSMDLSDNVVNKYLDDLSDADLMRRPVDGMNHIAWQLGHLISAERMFVEAVRPGSSPALPEGFDEAHNKEAAKSDDKSKFLSKAEYIRLMQTQRAATKKALDATSDADLDAPSPERWRGMWPTVGMVYNMVGNHVLMHVGQWVAVRREVGKPVVI